MKQNRILIPVYTYPIRTFGYSPREDCVPIACFGFKPKHSICIFTFVNDKDFIPRSHCYSTVTLNIRSVSRTGRKLDLNLKTNEPGREKMCLMPYANIKGADQPAHPRSLISAFVVRCLDSIISLDCIAEISRL